MKVRKKKMVLIRSDEVIIYDGRKGKFESYYKVGEDLYDEEIQDKIAKYILKLMKHENMVVDFKNMVVNFKPSTDDIIFTLRKELNCGNEMVVFVHGHYNNDGYCPYSMYKVDVNLENIKIVLRKATEIMFGTVNA